jgi:hypothetical protein
MALILCYCLELKDKPSEIHPLGSYLLFLTFRLHRIKRDLPCLELHDPITNLRAQFWYPNIAHPYPHLFAE